MVIGQLTGAPPVLLGQISLTSGEASKASDAAFVLGSVGEGDDPSESLQTDTQRT
jgi:hypothetical protein